MRIITLILFFCQLAFATRAQVTTGFNFSSSSSDYVGWDSNTLFDLNIRHEGNFPIVFSTNNLERMRLTDDGRLLINQSSSIFGASLDVVGRSVGVRGQAVSPSSAINYGGWFTGAGSAVAYGVRGDAINITSGINYGVAGIACDGQTNNYAVFGQVCGGASPGSWAGYFDGPAFTTGDMWTPSDENLKTNIETLTGATDMLMSLDPKTYVFDSSIEAINLPTGLQYGLIAQELSEVIPHAVRDVSTPERLDDDGNVVVESIDIKAVNYSQLIPVLVAAFKERQTELDQQQELITQLEQAIDAAEIQMSQSSGN